MNTKIVANMNCMAYISSTKAIKARRHGDSSSLDGKSCLPSQIGQQQFNKRICYVFEGKKHNKQYTLWKSNMALETPL
jgi:hypothetical protein